MFAASRELDFDHPHTCLHTGPGARSIAATRLAVAAGGISGSADVEIVVFGSDKIRLAALASPF